MLGAGDVLLRPSHLWPRTVTASAPATRAEQAAHSRDRILDAALECIESVSLVHASSAAIARQAGMTWGAIQHHFGTRAELLLSVIERNFWELEARVRRAAIAGGTVLDRLQAFADVAWDYCRDVRYRVSLEILMEIRRDAESFAAYEQRIARIEPAMNEAWEHLFGQVLEQTSDRAVLRILFSTMRGFAVDHHTNPRPSEFTRERALLVQALAAELERSNRMKGSADG